MRFFGAFECSKCGKQFTIDLGPKHMSDGKTPQKIGKGIGQLATMFAQSCSEHEQHCTAKGDEVGNG